jgi:hypothetical protein
METAETLTGTGADSPSPLPAAAEGTPLTSEGADSPITPEAAPAITETPAEGEITEGAEIPEEKKGHQKTLEERAEEIADKKIQQRIAEAENRSKVETAAQPDFVPVDYNAYDNHIAKLIVSERQIQDDLSLDSENPAELVRALRKVQQERNSLETAFTANEQKRQSWEDRNKLSQQEEAYRQQTQADIDRSVAAIPQARGITPEALQAGQKYIAESFQKDPALQKRFNDIISHKTMYQGFSGVDAAVEWAVTYAQENMGKAATASLKAREEGKEKTLGGGEGGDTGNISTFSDLLKLPSVQVNQFAKEHPQKFEDLKKAHFK